MEKFKTLPFNHQLECLNKFGRKKAFALLAEQGTGKTWIIINNIADLWASSDLNGVLVFAPNGVHYNWVLREIPLHMPDWVRFRAAAWNANPTKADRIAMENLFEETDSSVLRIFVMNMESLQHDRGIEAAKRFATSCSKLMIVGDESSSFKNPKARRTKELMKLKRFSDWRRIMDGTPLPNGPFDLWSQFNFLDEAILGETSFTAFKAEHAEMLERGHPLLENIIGKKLTMPLATRDAINIAIEELLTILAKNGRAELFVAGREVALAFESGNYEFVTELTANLRSSFNPDSKSPAKLRAMQLLANVDQLIADHLLNIQRSGYAPGRIPQIVARGKDKRPKYRNLDKLSAKIAPHSFRVLKKDCLDLPDKIYKTAWFDMTAEQRAVYTKAEKENRLALNGEETAFNKLVAHMKLNQITSGYFLHPDAAEPVRIEGDNPKLTLLRERANAVIEAGSKLIVWARFRVQIADVVKALKEDGRKVVEYHGGVGKSDRVAAIEAFERGEAEVFVGQQQAGGRGLTLIAADNVFYFSNDYALDHRLQSEDRAHRIGQEDKVIYTDFCARDSADMECIETLRSKERTSEIVLGALQ